MRIISPRARPCMKKNRPRFRTGLQGGKRPVSKNEIVLALAHIPQAMAARNPIAIRHAPFWRQAVSIWRTCLKGASFFSGHGKICDHVQNFAVSMGESHPKTDRRLNQKRTLMLQQPFLALQSAAITSKRAIGPDHPVAGHHDGNGITAVGKANRPHEVGISQTLS